MWENGAAEDAPMRREMRSRTMQQGGMCEGCGEMRISTMREVVAGELVQGRGVS